MTIEEAWTVIDKHGWIVGPEWAPGWGERPRIGWAVYANWQDASADTYDLPGNERALGVGTTLQDAVQAAKKKEQVNVSD